MANRRDLRRARFDGPLESASDRCLPTAPRAFGCSYVAFATRNSRAPARPEFVQVEHYRAMGALGLIDDLLDADALLLVSAMPPRTRWSTRRQ